MNVSNKSIEKKNNIRREIINKYKNIFTHINIKMVKKGKIEEIFSKALYADNPLNYIITYRDFENFKEVNLKEFVTLSENFQLIPVTRIIKIQRRDKTIYQKHSQ